MNGYKRNFTMNKRLSPEEVEKLMPDPRTEKFTIKNFCPDCGGDCEFVDFGDWAWCYNCDPPQAWNMMLKPKELKPNEYQCARCQRVFEKGWTDEEAKAEQNENGWGDIPNSQCDVVCDDCYKSMIGEVSPEEFNMLRNAKNKTGV
jgi:hypothetical protein